MVHSLQAVEPVFSQLIPEQDESCASTPGLPHETSKQPPPPLTQLSENGISAVHDFLVANDYESISNQYPLRARAMEIAWIITGIQHNGQHEQAHPLPIENLKSGFWKSIRVNLKSLMFDTACALNRSTGSTTLIVHHDSTRRPGSPLTPLYQCSEIYFPPHLADDGTSSLAIAKAAQAFLHDVCLEQIRNWEEIAKSKAHFVLNSTAHPKPFYVAGNYPPLIPPPPKEGGAVRIFPILNRADFDAQLKDTSFDTADPADAALKVAYKTIQQQNSQILILDDWVRKLLAEKQALEDEHSLCCGLDTTHINPAVATPTPRAVPPTTTAAPTRHVRSSTITTTPTRSNRSTVVIPGTRHVISSPVPSSPTYTTTSRSRGTPFVAPLSFRSPTTSHARPAIQTLSPSPIRSTQQSRLQAPTQSTQIQKVAPLHVLGQATVDAFDEFGIPDHHHTAICELVESTLPRKWESSLLGSGICNADEVREVIKAMESDIGRPSD